MRSRAACGARRGGRWTRREAQLHACAELLPAGRRRARRHVYRPARHRPARHQRLSPVKTDTDGKQQPTFSSSEASSSWCATLLIDIRCSGSGRASKLRRAAMAAPPPPAHRWAPAGQCEGGWCSNSSGEEWLAGERRRRAAGGGGRRIAPCSASGAPAKSLQSGLEAQHGPAVVTAQVAPSRAPPLACNATEDAAQATAPLVEMSLNDAPRDSSCLCWLT